MTDQPMPGAEERLDAYLDASAAADLAAERQCRCTEELAKAACPDHGVLAFLRAAWAEELGSGGDVEAEQ